MWCDDIPFQLALNECSSRVAFERLHDSIRNIDANNNRCSIHHYYKCATLAYLRKSIFFSVSTLNTRFRHVDKRNAIVAVDPGIVPLGGAVAAR